MEARDAITSIVIVLLGGGLGAVARWKLSMLVQEKCGCMFPLGTLVVNVLGSFLLGFVLGAAKFYGVFTREQRLFLATGFAGGFTTFSTFSYETFTLLSEMPLYAALNIVANVLAGLAAVYLGMVAAGVLYGRTMG
ncbi:fluoride efflux transporter CrcB [Pyrolobus fumarii]|nr:fluoride efflux transporter CrcB [Pyrolobus fumarii]